MAHRADGPGGRSPADVGTGAASIEGERRLVTVVFADVIDSTAIAEALDPEDWAEVMNRAFVFMNAAIRRYGGTVSRLMGDAVLALFGAPTMHEDDAERAVRAALEIRDAAGDYAREVRQRHGVSFGLRVGVHTGIAVLGELGDATRHEYTAMGDTPNVAARLQSVARPGSVLVSGDTWRLVRHVCDGEPRGATELKGRRDPIETWEVTAVRALPERARGTDGLRAPLIGRVAQLERLRAAVAGVQEGAGAVIAVVGEAGLGKSRLVAELREEAAARPVRWLECRGLSYGQSVAYHPWQQLGYAVIGADATDAAADVRRALHAFCRDAGIPDADVPYLATMLAVDTEASRAAIAAREDVDVAQPLATAVIDAIRSAMHARGSPVPYVLVFDDLHWADRASVELLGAVATLASTEPLLILCLLRPDRHAPSWPLLERLRGSLGGGYTQLQLDPLDRAATRELLTNLLHVRDMPEHVHALILDRTDGNPFFLEEVIRSLIDYGHLVRDDGGWRATEGIAGVEIPDTLAGVLAARLDRLPDPTRRVAQAAAVVGRVFQHRVLASVCRRASARDRIENVEPHLSTLRYEELVRERSPAPEREYIFKHALTCEAAYALLLRRRRRELHGLAARVLEELYPERLEQLAAELARHYHEAGDAERAVEHAVRAAEQATRLHALHEAEDNYARALAALDRIPDAPAERRLDVLLDWTVVRYRLRRYESVIERLETAQALAREHGDRERLARVLSWIALMHMLTGFPSRAEPYLVEGSELASELGAEQLMLLPFFFATDAMVDRDPRGAIERMVEVVEMARRHRMPEIEGHAVATIALAYARIDDMAAATEYIERALAAAPSGGHRVKEADVHLIVGLAYLEMDRIAEGLEHLRQGTDLARAEGAFECVCAGTYSIGIGELEKNRVDEALAQFSASLDAASRAGWGGWTAFLNRIRSGVAAARLESGNADALGELEKSLEDARSAADEYQVAVLSQRLARVYGERGDRERAAALLDDALAYYRRAGMARYEARALQEHARLLPA